MIRMALLEADVALPVAKALVERVRDRALGEEVARSLNPGQAFVKIVHDELVAVLGGDASSAGSSRPSRRHHARGPARRGQDDDGRQSSRATHDGQFGGAVLLASTDVYRPAARAQLAKIGDATSASGSSSRRRTTRRRHRDAKPLRRRGAVASDG